MKIFISQLATFFSNKIGGHRTFSKKKTILSSKLVPIAAQFSQFYFQNLHFQTDDPDLTAARATA